jgi:hypothetical protein
LDYIQEELTRQRQALAALMLGGSQETRETSNRASTSESAGIEETLAAILAAAATGDLTDGTALLDGGAIATLAAQRVQEKLAGSAEPSETAALQSSAETMTDRAAATEERTAAAAMRNTAAERRETIRAGAVSRRQTGTAAPRANVQTAGNEDVAAVWAAAGGGSRSGTDVREVSRAVQRDARRYDGGFSIY